MNGFYAYRAGSFVKNLPVKHQQLIEEVRQKYLKKWIQSGKAQIYSQSGFGTDYKARLPFNDPDSGKPVVYWLYFYQRKVDSEIVLINIK